MSAPRPGSRPSDWCRTQSLEYRKGNQRYQRCSLCQREKALQHSIVLHVERVHSESFKPVMVGDDLIGIVCADCVAPMERAIQALFPDSFAWPFIDIMGELQPTPRCECGTVLVHKLDGTGMQCPTCDAAKVSV